jgi:hypothetical protein
MRYRGNSAASELGLARFGLRIVPAMQPSPARGETAECVAKDSSAGHWAGASLVAEAVARGARRGAPKESCDRVATLFVRGRLAPVSALRQRRRVSLPRPAPPAVPGRLIGGIVLA